MSTVSNTHQGYASNALSIELVWLSSLFVFLGGGDKVLFSMVVTIVADTVDRTQRFVAHASLFRADQLTPI